MKKKFGDIGLRAKGHVTLVEMQRPPYNFFDAELVGSLADAYEYLDTIDECRVIVLCAQGRAFSAGADFKAGTGRTLFSDDKDSNAGALYGNAVRMFRASKPVVAAVQGPAIGGGLGLALSADFRVICENTRFAANFVKLGVHAGFGISHTLPRIVGEQNAARILYTGQRVGPEQAMAMGLGDMLSTEQDLLADALALAAEIAEAAPLAVESTRATLRMGLADAVEKQLQRELSEQQRLSRTEDHREGISAVSERRSGNFSKR
ncbi:MAG: enoyl-CoA hydratase/isomerase family protein [Halioglobus sp.]|jgi:enoyl-CoA hydratase/carnithine racemase|uniref:enoyl-CoA hydratase/isomerase family protein n=1 Tax=Haliea salexigens TaxID=287487 RepID=UPI00041D9569|nr:enoyl-CoA hydratase/isomerase family protein [Haliea salexigens]MAT94289.1 enoyl-CoA hydratase/isomerase family protein [Halioglobus sp.]|tara:strand:+ start:1487 stop:2275 length:789 start_codon:yes stop_codon:yes gene_type:complete